MQTIKRFILVHLDLRRGKAAGLLKYYDVKDPLSLVQKISKRVLSMP